MVVADPMAKKNEMLAKFYAKEITQEQLDEECAYWFLDCFSEIRLRPMPSMPVEYREYLDLPTERKYKIGPEFFQISAVKNYLRDSSKVRSENYAELMRMKEFLVFIPKEDFVSQRKFHDKIAEFSERLYHSGGAF